MVVVVMMMIMVVLLLVLMMMLITTMILMMVIMMHCSVGDGADADDGDDADDNINIFSLCACVPACMSLIIQYISTTTLKIYVVYLVLNTS